MDERLCPNCNKPYQAGDEVCRFCGFILPLSAAVIPAGTILQTRYEIQDLVHSGGMGYVYLATDKRLYDRLCIVKQIKEPIKSETHRKKLEEEALRMARLDHPNVAIILDHFIDGGYYFLVVERIHGRTLSEVFKEHRGRLTESEVVGWSISICDVVSYLHKEGVVHRDISPDNIMLTGEGSIKFIDFGTLRELRYIVPGGTAGMGKYGYTPPEQWQGKPEFRSDIFALGATIYYLLTGFLPLSKEYLVRQTPQKDDFNPSFPPVRTKNPSISPQLEVVLQKALQLDVNDRYYSVEEFGQALRNLGHMEVKKLPLLSLKTKHLDFANVKSGATVTKPIILKNTGTGKLTGELTTTQPWLKVSPDKIDLKGGEWKGKVTVNTRHLGSGFYGAGAINITTNAGQAKIIVDLSVARVARPQAVSKPEPVTKLKPTAKPKPVTKPKPTAKPRLKIPLRWALISLGIVVLVVAGAAGVSLASRNQATPSPALAIQGVSVLSITDTSAALAWTTDKPATSQAAYGHTAALESTTTLNQEPVTSHSVKLTSLEPNTTYYFKVMSKDADGKEAISDTGQLTTLPGSIQPITPAPIIPATGPVTTPVSPAPIELSYEAKTYTNDQYGFSLQYPDSWVWRGEFVKEPYIAAFSLRQSLPGIRIGVLTNLTLQLVSADWLVESYTASSRNVKVLSGPTETTLADGTKAWASKLAFNDGSYDNVAYDLEVDKNGVRIRLMLWTSEISHPYTYDEGLFSEIAHTLTFKEIATSSTTPAPTFTGETSYKSKSYVNDQYGFSVQYPSDWVERPDMLTTPYHLATFSVEAYVPGIAMLAFDADAPESVDWIKNSIKLIKGTTPRVISKTIKEETTPDGSKAYTYEIKYFSSLGYEGHGYAMDVDRGTKRLRFQVYTVDEYEPYDEKLFSEIAHTLIFKAPEKTATVPPPAEPSYEAKTYTNDQYGFSVKYPADWVERPELLTSPYHLAAFGVQAMAPGVVVYAFDADAPESEDWFVKTFELINVESPQVISPIKTETLPDGTKAYTYKSKYISATGFQVLAYILDAEKDGKRIRVNVFTVEVYAPYDEALFSEIAHTVRFTTE